jgi:hypothetical protein
MAGLARLHQVGVFTLDRRDLQIVIVAKNERYKLETLQLRVADSNIRDVEGDVK